MSKNSRRKKIGHILEQAISLSSDNDMIDVRNSIRRALNQLAEIDRRSSKRKVANETEYNKNFRNKWIFEMNKGLVNPFTPKDTLSLIDKMIKDESEKIKDEGPEETITD